MRAFCYKFSRDTDIPFRPSHFKELIYYALGHLWGRCANGTEGLGCAPPETFKNCADVSIGVGTPPTNGGTSSLQQSEVDPETTRKPYTTTLRTPQYPKRNQSRPLMTTTYRTTTTTTLRTTSRRTTQFGLGPYQDAPFRPNFPPARLINPIRYVCGLYRLLSN